MNIQDAFQCNSLSNANKYQIKVLLQLQSSLIVLILVVRLALIYVFSFPPERLLLKMQ